MLVGGLATGLCGRRVCGRMASAGAKGHRLKSLDWVKGNDALNTCTFVPKDSEQTLQNTIGCVNLKKSLDMLIGLLHCSKIFLLEAGGSLHKCGWV